ncbi:MAG: YegP family protein [Myxococcales bacterium]|nr:YegP family protein [Myxococcales bacterium]
MNFPCKSTLAIFVLALGMLGGACAPEQIGASANGVSGRPSFELFEGHDGQYYFNLAATNHEIVLSSEGYASRTGALSGILSVLNNAGDGANYELREATNSQFYFVLQAQNGETIGMSELYSTKGNATQGIENTADVTDTYIAFLATRTGARFTILEGQNGLYYFNLKAANGEIVLQSQAYGSEAAAMNATFAIVDSGALKGSYDIEKAKEGQYYFNLKAANGEIIGTSEMYYSKSNAKRAVNSVIKLLPNVNIL